MQHNTQMHARSQEPLVGGRSTALSDFCRAGKRFLQKEFNGGSIQKLKPESNLSFSILSTEGGGFRMWADRPTKEAGPVRTIFQKLLSPRNDQRGWVVELTGFCAAPVSPECSSNSRKAPQETNVRQSQNARWLPENTEHWLCLLNKFLSKNFSHPFQTASM